MALAVKLSPEVEKQFADMMAQRENPEPLDPELERYREEGVIAGLGAIRHPLVYSIGHHPVENARLNMMLRAKREAIAEATAQRDYGTIVWLYERPWRLNAFMGIAPHLPNATYWRLLGDLWTDSENIYQCFADWREVLTGRSTRLRSHMMNDMDRALWRKLRRSRGVVPVWRGFAGKGRDGMSWTLDRERAVWFAQRFAGARQGKAYVAAGTVEGRHIIAYFNVRGESEVVAFPEDVHCLGVRRAL